MTEAKKPGIFSFFSGIGLLDLGFERSGFETAFVNEYHAPFLSAYKHTREVLRCPPPRYGYCGDSIEAFVGTSLAELASNVTEARRKYSSIGFIGGPPCPDFSVGGKNRGKDGENGKLSKTYIDLIMKCEPDWFLFENVKGLWRTKRHREFFDSLITLLSTKYNVSSRLMNAIEAGAPQDRDRIFLFGALKSNKCSTVSQFDWDKELAFPYRKAFEEFEWPTTDAFEEGGVLAKPNSLPLQLTVQHWFDKNKTDQHPNSRHHFQPKAGLAKFQVIPEGDDAKKSFKRLHRWRYSPTAAYGNNEVHLHPYRARRLSAAEALAIQTAPKEFVLPSEMSLTNMFKSIGNGVPVILAEHIARRLLEALATNGLQHEAQLVA